MVYKKDKVRVGLRKKEIGRIRQIRLVQNSIWGGNYSIIALITVATFIIFSLIYLFSFAMDDISGPVVFNSPQTTVSESSLSEANSLCNGFESSKDREGCKIQYFIDQSDISYCFNIKDNLEYQYSGIVNGKQVDLSVSSKDYCLVLFGWKKDKTYCSNIGNIQIAEICNIGQDGSFR